MAFPASQQSQAAALARASSVALTIKQMVQNVRNDAASGPVPRKRFILIMGHLTKAIDAWDQVAAVPGIAQYARDQYNDQNLNIAAEFVAMRAATVSLRDWIFNGFPQNGGAWLVSSYTNDGTEVVQNFTQAQLASFVTECDALLATIV